MTAKTSTYHLDYSLIINHCNLVDIPHERSGDDMVVTMDKGFTYTISYLGWDKYWVVFDGDGFHYGTYQDVYELINNIDLHTLDIRKR